jgi:hypothetical protein
MTITVGTLAQGCKCKRCVAMCEDKPCWGTPAEIAAIMDAGFRNKLTEYGSSNGVETISHIQPSARKDNPRWPDGPCAFLRGGLCELHDAGLKPSEGRLAMHGAKIDHRGSMIESWRGRNGAAVVDRFRAAL